MRDNSDWNIKLDGVWSGLGGCAANISYGLNLLGHAPRCISPVGRDDIHLLEPTLAHDQATYADILITAGAMSRAFIVTDPKGEQRTYFAPGPEPEPEMWRAHMDQQTPSEWVIQAAQQPILMVNGLRWAKDQGAATIWSPGQYADQLSTRHMRQCMALVDVLITNRDEADALARAGAGAGAGVAPDPSVWQIVTAGAHDISLTHEDKSVAIVVPTATAIDPTGCGDAFVAGVSSELARWNPGQIDFVRMRAAITRGITLSQACLGEYGCQNHTLLSSES